VLWTALAGIPVAAWWYLFLIEYPAQFKEYIEAVREKEKLLYDRLITPKDDQLL
jgi:hypothetical protein